MLKRVFILVLMVILVAGFGLSNCWAKVINVQGDQPTIQAGIDAASNGDTVEVSPGTYFENINFNGKIISVTSSGGPVVTQINGSANGPVAIFLGAETPAAVLSGFTITNGFANASGPVTDSGGGIYISGSSPTISGNIITGNAACSAGGGIALNSSSSIIENNVIRDNIQKGCEGGLGGGGILVENAGFAQILNNTILNNSMDSTTTGGGIALISGGAPLVLNNIIGSNSVGTGAPGSEGGGVYITNTTVTMMQNLIINNMAGQGAGIWIEPSIGAVFFNNTVAMNSASLSKGSALYAFGTLPGIQFINNFLVGAAGQNAVFCDNGLGPTPTFTNNDSFSPGGSGLQGDCASQAAISGNIALEPDFVDTSRSNFRLLAGSPGIDAGSPSAPKLPATDLDGLPRIVDGTGDGKFIIDMGAYEFQPVTVTPSGINYGVRVLGGHTARDVVLTNHQKRNLIITSIMAGGEFSSSSFCPGSLPAGMSCTIAVTFAPTVVGTGNGTLTVNDSDTNGPRKVPLSGIGVSSGTPAIVSVPPIIDVGDTFSITGTNFTPGSVVNLFVATGGPPIKKGPFIPIAQSPSQLTVTVLVTVPLGEGFVSVQVVNTDVGFKVSNPAYALLQGSASAGLPTIASINGTRLAATSNNPDYATNNVETVVVPGTTVRLGGTGFDTVNGVAIDLFCACPGGKLGPFLLRPGTPGLSETVLSFTLPVIDPPGSATGPGSFVVSNRGPAGTYLKKSNAVSVPIGAAVSVSFVNQSGRTMTVDGTGFSTLTVVNLFNNRPTGAVNLGGLKPDGTPTLPLTIISASEFSFSLPASAIPGPSYVQVLNPPFVPFTSSGTNPAGAFTLK